MVLGLLRSLRLLWESYMKVIHLQTLTAMPRSFDNTNWYLKIQVALPSPQ